MSIRSLYYRDRNSRVFWRWSKQSTLGQQPFEDLRETACRYIEQMYRQLEDDASRLTRERRAIFEKYRAVYPLFLTYYRNPGIGNLLRFARRSPSWAVSSLLSLFINYFKFR